MIRSRMSHYFHTCIQTKERCKVK